MVGAVALSQLVPLAFEELEAVGFDTEGLGQVRSVACVE